ncbi:Proteasome activator complex subunit 4 [Phytophthora pseudosyringae]|uniref:Proteasome activator complex subunit 4 n=1 Tax=Phytophthora pseudosyringae TaxID=221518 RepID=A0A8T1V9G9_9STRA|nr:Proteasome activator complex subunit 4 [Phytophthora pseudosyringae]
MAATRVEPPVETVHPYYRLLPSHVAPESVQAEREDFLRRIQETLGCLESLRDGGAQDNALQNRHFRDVDTLFKLKHELPLQLHAQLIRALVKLLWTRDARPFTDVDMEIRAVKSLQLLLRKWKKRQSHGDAALADGLVIDWRSVKRAIERVCFRASGGIQQASQIYLASLTNTTVKCAEVARSFFRATDPAVPFVVELWAEFGAAIKDVKTTECFRALAFFSFFVSLPTSEDAKTEKAVVELFPEWFTTWSLISRCTEWDGHWMKILSRVSKQYPSTTMLGDYLPFVFAKVNDLLELPSDLGSSFKKQLWPSAYASINGSKRFGQHAMRLCVHLLRDTQSDERDDAPTRYLLEVLSLMKSFFHPSNVANVGNSLATFVYYLSNTLAKRLGRERKDRKRLQLVSVSKVVDALLEICLLGIYSKNRGVATKCMYVMKNLLCIDPARCAAPVMQEMLKALDPMAMSHSHLAVTAISSMAVFVYQLMCGRHPQTVGLFFATYLEPMLKLTLPGIDANDEKKTQSTVQLYFRLLSWLPIVNDPAKINFQTTKQRGELSNQLFADMEKSMFAEIGALDSQLDERMWGIGPFLEEWALAVLDRCFQFIQSRSSARSASSSTNAERARNGISSQRDGSEDAIVLQVLNLLAILYVQLSPEIYTQSLRKTVSFVSNAFYPTSFGGKVVSTLIFNCMQGNPSEAIAKFMPLVLEKFHVTKSGINVSSLMANEKVWHLRILNGLVRFSHPDDPILLRYQHELEVILAHFLNNDKDKEVYEAAGDVLRHLLFGLLGVYTHDFRSLPAAEWADATSCESGAFQYLGIGISWNKLSVGWHEPNKDELAFGFKLLQSHVVGALGELERMMEAKDLTVRSWTRLLNQVFQGLLGAANVLIDESVLSNSALLDGAKPLLLRALGSNSELYKDFASLKGSLMKRVHGAVVFWRERGSGSSMESQVWRLLLGIVHQLLIWSGEHLDEFGMKEAQNVYSRMTSLDVASHAYQKSRPTPKGEQALLLSRNELVEKVMFFYAKRNVQQHFALASAIMQPDSDEETRQRYTSLLTEVEQLLKNPYEDVRSNASSVMKECSVLYARWLYFRQPKQIEELGGLGDVAQLKEEHVSGVLHMLSLPLARRNLWKQRDTLLQRVLVVLLNSNDAIVKQVDSEVGKAKVEVKVQAFFLSLLSNWRYIRNQKIAPPLLEVVVAAEPSPTDHWKFQLMHLVMLYPFLQTEEMPISLDVWKLVIRQLSNEVLPVRQVALEIFRHLLKLLKHNRNEGGSRDVELFDELIYSDSTMQVLLNAFVNNHKNSNKFAASADGQHADSAPSDWSFGVNEVVRYISNNTQSFPKAPPLSPVRLLNQASNTVTNVSLSNVKLIQKLVQQNPKAFFGSCATRVLEDLARKKIGADTAEEDRQAALKTLAGCIAGLLHSLVKLYHDDEETVMNHVAVVVNLLKGVLPQVSIVLVDQWVEVVYLSSRPSRSGDVKLCRLEPLVNYLLDELEDSFARATVEDYARQAKWLALVEAVGVHLLAAGASARDSASHTLASEFGERVLKVIREHALAHQYKIIRDRVGKMLFLLGAYAFPPSPWSKESSLFPVAQSSLPLSQLVAASASIEGSVDDAENKTSGRDSENDTLLHATETAMQWLSCCEKHGDGQDLLVVLDELLPIALLAQSHPKAEVAVQAKNVTDAAALSLRMYFVPHDAIGERALTQLLELLKRLSTSRTWKTRGAVLRFTMTFAFYHWVFFSSDLKEQVHAFVCSFLTDEQREVQAMAKYALRGLLHNEEAAAVEAMSVRLTESAGQARVKFPKLKRRCGRLEAEGAPDEELKKVHERLKTLEAKMTESVLSLSAIVLAFPHDVPTFVPPIFEELGRFLYMKRSSNTISFLVKAVKETLLDFKRTHQDNWLETKAKFSHAQLDVIEDVAIAPSYFS